VKKHIDKIIRKLEWLKNQDKYTPTVRRATMKIESLVIEVFNKKLNKLGEAGWKPIHQKVKKAFPKEWKFKSSDAYLIGKKGCVEIHIGFGNSYWPSEDKAYIEVRSEYPEDWHVNSNLCGGTKEVVDFKSLLERVPCYLERAELLEETVLKWRGLDKKYGTEYFGNEFS